MSRFQKAVKEQRKLRMALIGPSGAGKTYSALSIAKHLGETIAVIDTERGSSALYGDDFDFSKLDLKQHTHQQYIDAINEAAAEGFNTLIIDSLSHVWFQSLEMAGKFNDWSKVRPLERKLIAAILDYPGHVICTMRSKTQYVVEEKVNKSGRTTSSPTKVGLAPIQSGGIEYEFDVTGQVDLDHLMTIDKTRCKAADGSTWPMPGKDFADLILNWLTSGGEVIETPDQRKARLAAVMAELGLKGSDVVPTIERYGGKNAKAIELTSGEIDQVINDIRATSQVQAQVADTTEVF
jgi:ABC-type dipeptide/oligopeptide/nickel transport system ATPase component